MSGNIKKIILISLIAILAITVFSVDVFAQDAVTSGGAGTISAAPAINTQTNNATWWGLSIMDAVNTVLALGVNMALSTAAFIMSIAAAILNVSIVVTLNIKEFVNATPAIYEIWKTIRDISGLFFIFFLIWAALKIILGLGNGYKKLLIYIVIAGILVNFSFFITSVLIDASNVASQAIYNSMIPNGAALNLSQGSGLTELTAKATGYDARTGQRDSKVPGISDIFMNSLKIQKFYDIQNNRVGTAVGDPFKIVLIGFIGIIVMLTAALSFALAAAAFIARLVILLFLLAFSPFWCAALVFPSLRNRFDFAGTLSTQLIFMPAYLLLMYAALTILSQSNIMGDANASTTTSSSVTNWVFSYIVLFINFAMVIIMLNLPLLVGLKMGEWATGWMSKAMGKANSFSIWKNVGGWTRNRAASIPQNTIGGFASSINNQRVLGGLSKFSPSLGMAASKGLSKVSGATFGGKKGGYDAAMKQQAKDIEAMHKRLGEAKSFDRRDFVSEDDFKEAKKQAKEQAKLAQANFRESLITPNLSMLSHKNILNKMLASRAMGQSAAKLGEKAEKEAKKAAKSEAKKRMKENYKEASATEDPIRLKQLAEEREKLQDAIDSGTEIENEERDEKILSKIEETAKKEDKDSKS